MRRVVNVYLFDLDCQWQTLGPLAVAVNHPVGLVIHRIGRHCLSVFLIEPAVIPCC